MKTIIHLGKQIDDIIFDSPTKKLKLLISKIKGLFNNTIECKENHIYENKKINIDEALKNIREYESKENLECHESH